MSAIRLRISEVVLLGTVGMLMTTAFAVAQQPLNWAADDSGRVARLAKDGSRLEGEHVIVWFPASLAGADAEALVKRLDPGVAGLWQRIGTHEWQAVAKGKITYYLSDDSFASHASGRAGVFVPMARVRDGRAPFLHETVHELLASNRNDPRSGVPPIRRLLWLTEGLADYIARLVAADIGITEPGPFDTPTIAAADAICAERARTPDGATMIPYIGSTERPEVLFTTDRSRFAPTFYTCSLSFVNHLSGGIGLSHLVELFALGPVGMNSRLDRLDGRKLSLWRTEWLRQLHLDAARDDFTRIGSFDNVRQSVATEWRPTTITPNTPPADANGRMPSVTSEICPVQ